MFIKYTSFSIIQLAAKQFHSIPSSPLISSLIPKPTDSDKTMNLSGIKEALPVSAGDSDRVSELRAFDASKAGVKGLVDSGIQTVPKIFIRPAEERTTDMNLEAKGDLEVPVIDLSGIEEGGDQRKRVVGELGKASREWGFFQVVQHGIPEDVLGEMLEGVRKFHEQDLEKKKEFHTREMMQKVKYGSNVDLYRSKAANWRDSLTISMTGPDRIQPHDLPQICRDSTINYIEHFTKLGDTLFELLSEALGLQPDHLGALECAKAQVFIGHYYPSCPEPELTMGTSKHTDPSFLTIVLQDQLGGLQVFHNNQYINIPAIPGSFVVNIGDMLQIITNDEFISADHRVLANKTGPRISVAGFLTGNGLSGRVYEPIKELTSVKNPPRYKEFTVREYVGKFFQRPIDKSGLDEFRLLQN